MSGEHLLNPVENGHPWTEDAVNYLMGDLVAGLLRPIFASANENDETRLEIVALGTFGAADQ